jgi:hypothetical protein
VETYGVAPAPPTRTKATGGTATPTLSNTAPPETAEPKVVVVEEDDLSIPVPDGARCKRLGCGAEWEGHDVSRGDGEKAKCRHHPQSVSAVQRSKRYDYDYERLLLTTRAARIPRRIERLFVLQATCARVRRVPQDRGVLRGKPSLRGAEEGRGEWDASNADTQSHNAMAFGPLAGRSLTIAEPGGDRAVSVGSLSDAHAGARLGVCKGVSGFRTVIRCQS